MNCKKLKRENQHFINAWHKYGRDNFVYVVLETFDFIDDSVLKERELYWMDFYQSHDRDYGYNLRRDS